LPKWRGAAPIQAALFAGETETGVSIIRLIQAMDAGPILLQERLSISPSDDYLSLEPRLASLGAGLLVRALEEQPTPQPQNDEDATYSKRISREDAQIDWSQPAEKIWNQVRAYRGWPQAFTTFGGRQLKVLRAWPLSDSESPEEEGMVALLEGVLVVATGRGSLRLDEVQLEGKRAQSGTEFLRGYPRLVGARLGDIVA
jgi:methionyl-tRNA formyltransferase